MSGYWHGLFQGLIIGLIVAWVLLGTIKYKLLNPSQNNNPTRAHDFTKQGVNSKGTHYAVCTCGLVALGRSEAGLETTKIEHWEECRCKIW